MSRFKAIRPESATGEVRALLEAVNASLGMVPNMMRAMAAAPAVLEGYLGLSGALDRGTLSARTREQLALAVGQANRCDYCVSAHTVLGRGAGLSETDMARARDGGAADPTIEAAVRFARTLVRNRGVASDAELAQVRQAGLSDGEIVEIVGAVAANIFTNYLNHVAATDIDFPIVRAKVEAAA